MFAKSILSILIWLPVFGAALTLLVGRHNHPTYARVVALTTGVATLLLCVPLVINFDTSMYAMQYQINLPWIHAYNIHYTLGIDGISLPMIILTCFTSVVVILASWHPIKVRVSQFMAAFLVMQGMMIGVFVSLDSILFYIFWEAMLIPMYLSIGIWGSANRSYASIKFFLYTFFGSALMLVALLYLRYKANSFAILDFYPLSLNKSEQVWLFLAFLLSFAVKVPMWPVHTWLPDAHTEAPAGGSVVLAALMLKMGAYGFLRFSLPITPDASQSLAWLMIILSLIAVVYVGLVAIAQVDMKKLIAYSSIAHMGFVTLGCFMIYEIVAHTQNLHQAYISLEGAMVQMVSHAFGAGAMFIGVGILYEQLHSRKINDFGGVATSMPIFSAFFMLFALSNVGLPGTSGFVGEFMVILGSFQANVWITLIAATTLILGAAYTLYMYKRVFFGEIKNPAVENLHDVHGMDLVAFCLLGFGVLFIGLYPQPLLNLFHTSIGHLLDLSLRSKLG